MARHKPGEIITPASFAVAPELLGKPLAKPSRRALAMAIDLLLLGILVKGGGVFFGLAAAFAAWRATARTGVAASRPKLRRRLRLAAAAVFFLIVVANWGFITHPLRRLSMSGGGREDAGDEDTDSAGLVVRANGSPMRAAMSGFAIAGEGMALRKATNEVDARRAANKLVRGLKHSGMSDRDLRRALKELSDDKDQPLPPVAVQALRDAIAKEAPPDSAATSDRPDSLASAYLRAATRGDSGALGRLQPRLATAFAGDSLRDLNATVSDLRTRNRKLTERIRSDSVKEASKAVGLMDTFANAGDELVKLLKKAGLGFGWTGLYFTAFVALMRGQTPGKRLLRIRIVRLDGRPMNWWSSLERFGGYAASVVTALGGFFQILWDKNRQAMHDKIAETVVVQE